jgi:hypothetical protein
LAPRKRGIRTGSPARGTRIPDDFAVTAEMVAWARAETPDVDGRFETGAFIDFWRGKTGKDATKHDWPATWRNWMRKAQKDAAARNARFRPGAPPHGFKSQTDANIADFLSRRTGTDAQVLPFQTPQLPRGNS